jgi:hypothetical protein
MPIAIKSKPCPACDGTGEAINGSGLRCPKCKGSGRRPGRVARVFRDPKNERPIVIELREEGLYVREHGRRTTYGPLSPGGILLAGARLYVEAKRQEKARKRAASRKGKRVRRGGVGR